MPICPNCDVAYLDEESHTCGGRAGESWFIAWRTLGGAACGAIGGFVLMTILCDVIKGARNIWCVFAGAVLGVPVGAAIGAVIADRRVSRRSTERERTEVFNEGAWSQYACCSPLSLPPLWVRFYRAHIDLLLTSLVLCCSCYQHQAVSLQQGAEAGGGWSSEESRPRGVCSFFYK